MRKDKLTKIRHFDVSNSQFDTLGLMFAVILATLTAMRLLIFSLLATTLLLACEKQPVFSSEVEEPEQPATSSKAYDNVDEILWPYFERYEIAANERGIDVDLSQVHGFLVSIDDDGVAGDCSFDTRNPNRVRVDLETWNQVGDNFKEYIVFHELGHCDRIRKHRETEDVNGICVSMMASGVGGCRENYNPTTREAHLDELFDEEFFGDWQ